MRMRGCVAEPRGTIRSTARKGVPMLKAAERNAESVWRVSLNTG